MNSIQIGGCPHCGKLDCVAGSCYQQPMGTSKQFLAVVQPPIDKRQEMLARLRAAAAPLNDPNLNDEAADMLEADAKELQILRAEVELYRSGCDKREARLAEVKAELAALKQQAEWSGVLKKRLEVLETELVALKQQAPCGTVRQKLGYPTGHCFVHWHDVPEPGTNLYIAAGAAQELTPIGYIDEMDCPVMKPMTPSVLEYCKVSGFTVLYKKEN